MWSTRSVLRTEERRFQAVYLVTFGQQKLCQVRAVLAGML